MSRGSPTNGNRFAVMHADDTVDLTNYQFRILAGLQMLHYDMPHRRGYKPRQQPDRSWKALAEELVAVIGGNAETHAKQLRTMVRTGRVWKEGRWVIRYRKHPDDSSGIIGEEDVQESQESRLDGELSEEIGQAAEPETHETQMGYQLIETEYGRMSEEESEEGETPINHSGSGRGVTHSRNKIGGWCAGCDMLAIAVEEFDPHNARDANHKLIRRYLPPGQGYLATAGSRKKYQVMCESCYFGTPRKLRNPHGYRYDVSVPLLRSPGPAMGWSDGPVDP